ncbi:MAG: galactokinase family protein [Candidatus Korarchaeota archaeon]
MEITVRAPARITFFGEHQDYFGLPVIPLAINRYVWIKGHARDDEKIRVELVDLEKKWETTINTINPSPQPRDYLSSGVNVFLKSGYKLPTGFDAKIWGNVPMFAGLGSSSAFVIGWLKFLFSFAGISLEPLQLAHLGYKAEVEEFHEPGGCEDHVASAFGGMTYMEPHVMPPIVERVNIPPGYFVIGDSREKKPTLDILARVKKWGFTAINELRNKGYPEIREITLSHIKGISPNDVPFIDKLESIIEIRDITFSALKELRKDPSSIDAHYIGSLLNKHHELLRDVLEVSTPKIDAMISAAIKAGALGGKIVGSGGGGCMFAYCLESPEKVARAIAQAGGDPIIVEPASGAETIK